MRALVLSGGANRGALQAGALPVLLEAGIGFDLLVGTSVGAFHAAFLASAPTLRRARELLQVWRDLRASDLVAGSRSGCVWNALRRRDHLCSARPLRRLIDRQVALRRLEEAVVPTVVVATELRTGSERRFTTGPIVDLVAASAALPGVFPPVVHEGDLLVDGGVLAPVPLGAALDEGPPRSGSWTSPSPAPPGPRPAPSSTASCRRWHCVAALGPSRSWRVPHRGWPSTTCACRAALRDGSPT